MIMHVFAISHIRPNHLVGIMDILQDIYGWNILLMYFSYCICISAELSCVPGSNPGENWQASVNISDVDFPSFCYSTAQ